MSIKSIIQSICVGIMILIGATSCTKDIAAPYNPGDQGSALVKLSIYTPSSSVPVSRAGEATADECTVTNVKLVVLELSAGVYRYRYMVDGQQIVQSTSNMQITTFNALLHSSDVKLKIFLVANHNDVFTSDSILEDMTEEQVKALLVDAFNDQLEGKLPLYGEVALDKLDASTPTSLEVTMLRAVARVDVNTVLEAASDDFRLHSVHVYRANDHISLAPAQSALTTPGKMTVSSATVPSGASEYPAFSRQVAADGDTSIIKTYLPESMPVTDANARVKTATCVVVGGYYADDTEVSYYRIDFNSGWDEHPFGQVLRNHKYIFNIAMVNSRGKETPDEAAEDEATAIIATMQVWNELTSEMWFSGNDNYIGISSRNVVLNYFQGSEKTEKLQATVPFRIQPLDDQGNPVGEAISADGQKFTTGFYELAIEKNSDDGEDIWRLVITSTSDNYTDEEFTGKFQVYTDWWTFDVTVTQEYYISERAGRYIRILTITDLDGDLGTTDGTFSELSGSAMRKVLENRKNFSPTGTVEIGGIIVYDLKNATITSESVSDMYILEKVLSDVDVVHLATDCTPGNTASQLLVQWHSGKANRVLIVGMDNDQTNANPILRDYLSGLEDSDPEDEASGTWLIHENASQLVRGYAEYQVTERFFEGVFGEVNSGSMGMTHMASTGYNNGYNAETCVSLIMIGQDPDNEGKMTHGVNTSAGVFYCGDSGITANRGTAMSDKAAADGTVHSDFDKLMGNIWAWIVERVTMVSQT